MPTSLMDRYNICAFAYNEEQNIQTSLRAIHTNVNEKLNKVYLIANGCTDQTVNLAFQYKQETAFERLEIVELALGDKCNAWNVYNHELSEPVGCHFMVDSDVQFTTLCFQKLFGLMTNSSAYLNVVAGMPQSGRNLEFYQGLVRDRSCFFGNLYGISPRFYSLIREKKFKLPIGLNWIDSFLTKAANTDLTFGRDNLPERVTFKENVGFRFESLSPFSISDLTLYKNRIARYELGKIQEIYLDSMPFEDWPENMLEINQDIYSKLKEKTEHLNFVKKYLVRKRLANIIEKLI